MAAALAGTGAAVGGRLRAGVEPALGWSDTWQGRASPLQRRIRSAGSAPQRRVRTVAPRAAAAGGRVRFSDLVRSVPKRGRRYLRDPLRRAVLGGIALLGGFFVAQTISLSFGAMGINDVVASALCVLFTEYVTRAYHTRAGAPSFALALLNVFKMGFTYGLFIDAFKLAS